MSTETAQTTQVDFNAQASSDEEICNEELQEMKSLAANKDEVIKKAVKKLADSGKYPDKTVICARICKLWTWISKSHITSIIDDDYKREYTKKVEPQPEDYFEEILVLMEEIHSDLGKISSDLFKKCRADKQVKEDLEKALTKSLHEFHENIDKYFVDMRNQLSKIGQLKNLVEYLNNASINIGLIKEMTDYREKLDAFMKMRLQMMFMEYHYADIADQLHYSSKWMSATGKDKSIMDLVNKLKTCPACGWEMAKWFVKAKIAEEKGLKIPPTKPGNGKSTHASEHTTIL